MYQSNYLPMIKSNTASVAKHIAHPISVRKVMGSMLCSNHNIAKSVKSCTYCCFVRCLKLIVCVGGMPWPQTGATLYHTQLGLPDKGCAIKGLVAIVWI